MLAKSRSEPENTRNFCCLGASLSGGLYVWRQRLCPFNLKLNSYVEKIGKGERNKERLNVPENTQKGGVKT